jgi:N-methylhydantoinase A
MVKITKTPSTPDDPSEGIHNALMRIVELISYSCTDVSALIHGTTTATNGLLEYKGISMALQVD